ncbi:DUF4435 domain-containing protein [Providencia sp. PROV269]|uniref:DUF4435 domain-containing protein n=1 Tax=Providencia sp. PROV269 TaxID=2949957 RepID=UPI00234A95ED|nr:DUF4435 domain-containing protein [Providencia sp. PROV269]
MTFKRTKSGLKNYNAFYNTEVIFYIEGKNTNQLDCEKLPDVIFYSSLIKAFSQYQKIKLKVVGNKSNVLNYHDKIVSEGIDDSYAIIDKDYDGIFFSRLESNKLLTTHGYSWENDFWSQSLCDALLEDISGDYSIAISTFNTKHQRSIRRLKLVNRANIIASYFGVNLFPIGKKGGDKGCNFDVKLNFPLSLSEVKRITRAMPNDFKIDLNYRNLVESTNLNFCNLVQGHFYEFIIMSLLSYSYKKSSGINNNINDFGILKNLALNKFKLTPDKYLNNSTLVHYENQFKKLI